MTVLHGKCCVCVLRWESRLTYATYFANRARLEPGSHSVVCTLGRGKSQSAPPPSQGIHCSLLLWNANRCWVLEHFAFLMLWAACSSPALCPSNPRYSIISLRGFPKVSDGKDSAMQETQVRSLDQEHPLEKEMATHLSIQAWETPWSEEPGGLQFMGSQNVTATNTVTFQEAFRLHSLIF